MLADLDNHKLIEYVYKRCKYSKIADEVIIITSIEKSDDELYNFCVKHGIPVFRGDLNNVLKRYLDASLNNQADIVCRVCGDSPFVDIEAIDKMFTDIEAKKLEYIMATNCLNGFMSEVFTLDLLQKVYNSDLKDDDKEHVTKYVRDNMNSFQTSVLDLNLRNSELQHYTLTIDYASDMKIAEKIVAELDGFDFSSNDIIQILKNMKE